MAWINEPGEVGFTPAGLVMNGLDKGTADGVRQKTNEPPYANLTTKRPVGFLNVDLEIESSGALEPLAKEMGKAVIVLYSGAGKGRGHFLNLEDSRWSNTPDAAALALCSAVEGLSVQGRRIWDGARRKEFNVGCDLIDGARMVQTALRRQTLKRIVALDATVAFTCYRGERSEPSRAASRSQPVLRKSRRKPASARSGRWPRG